jgi:Halobacterial output domain 1
MTNEQHTIREIFQPKHCQHFNSTEKTTDSLGIRLSEAMGTVLDTDSRTLDPLYNVVNPEALNEIFTLDSSHQLSTEVIFSWHDHAIRVRQPGEIYITNEPLVPELDADLPLATEFAGAPFGSTDAITYEYAPTDDLGTEVVLAVANAIGIDSQAVTERLADRINPDALNELFQPLADGTLRTNGYVSFGFEGYFITVSGNGMITIRSELAHLRENGGNILVIGDVPGDVFNAERSYLMNDPDSTRYDLFALLDRSPTALHRQATPAQPLPGTVEIVDYQAAVRSTAAATTSPQKNAQITPISGTLADLQTALIHAVAMQEEYVRDDRSIGVQLYLDTLQPVMEAATTDIATFLTPICRAVRGVEGLGYYTLPQERDSLPMDKIGSVFDATIELRVSERGPEQRWTLPKTGYTTEWFPIIENR